LGAVTVAADEARSSRDARAGLEKRSEPTISPAAFAELVGRLRANRGLDLQGYKSRYARRRIAVRLRARRCADLEEYLRVLDREPEEWSRLAQALAINVSSFYRNPETFAVIRDRVVPALISWRKERGQPRLRIWSAGCSEGEEAYSLAILLREHFAGALATMAVSILATDLESKSLALARAGSYPESRLAELPTPLREKYFRVQGERWLLRRRVAGLVEFARLDLLSQRGPAELDLIVCRNVLIYLSRAEQERILARFYQSLRPEGFLVLGKTETLIGPLRRAMLPVVPRERVYQKPAEAGARAGEEVPG
jgi:chemotaxis protein methyltransferase CheR